MTTENYNSILLGLLAASLSSYLFPIAVRKWEKRLLIKEKLAERLSKIVFLWSHYVKDEYDDEFSMADLTTQEALDKIFLEIRLVHSEAYLSLQYLGLKDRIILKRYLKKSQHIADIARREYREINIDDEAEVTIFNDNVMLENKEIASKALTALVLNNRHKL